MLGKVKLIVFIDLYTFSVKHNISGRHICPTAAVIVVDIPSFFMHGFMGMAAKNIINSAQSCVKNGAPGNFLREAQPPLAFPLHEVADPLVLEIKELDEIVYLARQNTQKCVVYEKVVELMAVDREISPVSVLPPINFVETGSGKRGKNIREPLIVVPLYPSHFCRLGQLADDRDQFPVVVTQSFEIEVFKNIAQEDQFLELKIIEKVRRFP